MDLAVIIVGMNQWREFTKPAVDSIRRHEPSARVYVMDCGSEAYPQGEGIIRLENSPSYAYALNQGIQAAGKADWYLLLNNDVLLHEPIAPIIERLDPSFIYGRQIITEKGKTWLGLWLALIPYQVLSVVGGFDENFLLCGFEDADYCVRAKEWGIATLPVEMNIHHYWGKTRWGLPHYSEVRAENMDYFERKHGYRLGENVTVIHD